ncbi:hypothetical protein ACFOYU_25570 [Microvirga sp. GCM10011540]|uniref:hypothetical protein n=1 Tax=Microvirga sp. GCM10011540 TaxID=3317338 RepID=UPI00360C4C7B
MTRIDWVLLPFLVAVLAGVALGAFLLAGFLGLGFSVSSSASWPSASSWRRTAR